jgi:hypothetical protein
MQLQTGSIKRLTGFAGFSSAITIVLSLKLDYAITTQAIWCLLLGFVVYQASQTFTDRYGKK